MGHIRDVIPLLDRRKRQGPCTALRRREDYTDALMRTLRDLESVAEEQTTIRRRVNGAGR